MLHTANSHLIIFIFGSSFYNKGNESTLLPKRDYTLFKFLAANLESLCLLKVKLSTCFYSNLSENDYLCSEYV